MRDRWGLGPYKKVRVSEVTKEPMDEKTKFLIPYIDVFLIDNVCSSIVGALRDRKWQVPGIEVDFYEYGEKQRFRRVNHIIGTDFKIGFGRIQGKLPVAGLNDTAAVDMVVMPKGELHVYEDGSGPTFYLYVGGNWERDRKQFINNSMKFHSKLDGNPRTYLLYRGSFFGLSQILRHDNDLGREYDPEGSEPKSCNTDVVMAEFRQYLQDVVLKMILSHPLPK